MSPASRSHPGDALAPEAKPACARRYTIADLSREFSITLRTIRFYEDLGLLQPERVGRQRIYGQRDRVRLGLILRGKRLGFSLHEAKELVMMYESPADTEPQLQAFITAIRRHREHLERQLVDLQATLQELQEHERRCLELLDAERHQTAEHPIR